MKTYLAPFIQILEDICLPLLSSVASSSQGSSPVHFIEKKEAILKSFIVTGFPSHVAMSITKATSVRYVCELAPYN